MKQQRIAVLIPCHNEELTVAKVVADFHRELPQAAIYVFDNASTDNTAAIARSAGALVIPEPRKGKGYVVESMMSAVDADYFVMVDGDDTYPANKVHELLAPVVAGRADMAVGARLTDFKEHSFRALHITGNNLVRGLVNLIFNSSLTDILSGYRAYNRRVTRRVPIVSSGFEVETELTIKLLHHGLTIKEVQVPYGARPAGSASKLRTFHDGARVLWKIFSLFRAFKPLTFFGSVGLLLLLCGLMAGFPPILDYARMRFVEHVPLAILASALVLMAFSFLLTGVLLHSINWRMRELHSVLVRLRD
jgi:glycosyltransferase involved in cell wall biosynthesis